MKLGVFAVMSSLLLWGCVETPGQSVRPANDARSGSATASRTAEVARRTDMKGNPLVTPGACRRILVEGGTTAEIEQTVRRVGDDLKVISYTYGIYRLNNGDLVAAETMEKFFENPKTWKQNNQSKGYRVRASRIGDYIRNGWYPPTARCTEGADLAADTGQRISHKRASSPGLLDKAVADMVTTLVTPSAGSGSTRGTSGQRCITVSGGCTGLDCIIDEITVSGGPGVIDNSGSQASVCSGYSGIEGTYQYTMKTNFDRLCSGNFQLSSRAQSGVTIDVFDDSCKVSYINEY